MARLAPVAPAPQGRRVLSIRASAPTYAGAALAVHSEADFDALVAANKPKLIVAMCKSSHCK